jgi:hypothetical protein
MTKLTNSRSTWKFEHLEDETIGSMTVARDEANRVTDGGEMFERAVKDALHKFLVDLPNGEILSDGYYRGFVPAPKPAKGPAPLCKSGADIRDRIGRTYDVNERHLGHAERVLYKCIYDLPGDEEKFAVYSAVWRTMDPVFEKLAMEAADVPASKEPEYEQLPEPLPVFDEKRLVKSLQPAACDTQWDDGTWGYAVAVEHVLSAMQAAKRKSAQSFVERRTREQSEERFSRIIETE